MSTTPAISKRINVSAREWFRRTVVEQPSERTRREFETWCAEDELHAAAFARYVQIWNEATMMKDLAHFKAPSPNRPWFQSFRLLFIGVRPLMITVGIAGIAVLAWVMLGEGAQEYSTEIGEVRDFTLADGSHVSLGAHSALMASIGRHERHVSLTSGEAYFEVTHDTEKPFVIDIGSQSVRVVGTKFDIRRAAGEVSVSVLEGVVRVISSGAPTSALGEHTLRAGERLDAEIAGPTVVQTGPIGSADPFAWRRGRLVYVDAPLRELVADANRYSTQQYEIRDTRLADERVSVEYPVSQVSQMMQGLAGALHFRVRETSSRQAEIEPEGLPARPR